MSAYVIFIKGRTLDEEQMRIYNDQALSTLADHDVRALAFYGAHQELEGEEAEGIVLLEFPSMAAAKAWYESEDYVRVRQYRLKGADFRVLLVQGKPD